MLKRFNKSSSRPREIVLDVETTGLFTADGHRIVEVAAVEVSGHRATGREFYSLVNPEREIPEEVVKVHGIDNAKVEDAPTFKEIAAELRRFIGDSTVVITCRTKDNYTLDIAFLNMEFERAGQPSVPESQWVNVRRWSENMFGEKAATLDKVLDRYGISRKERDDNGHSAILDARLLSEAYPRLLKDYMSNAGHATPAAAKSQQPKPNA